MKSNLTKMGILCLIAMITWSCQKQEPSKVLVFSKTTVFRHQSIEKGVAAIQKLGKENGFQVDHTEDAEKIHENNLKNYAAIIFLSTTGDVLNNRQQADFERYIQAGGGFVGIHAAADTEYDWPWYGKLVGGYFDSHPNNPNVREADLVITDKSHDCTKMFEEERWHRNDEWYNYKDMNPDVNVVMTIDESTYEGGTNGENHPMAWYHEYDGGRAFYTGSGHTEETFDEELFLQHLLGGIKWAMAKGKLNYSNATSVRVPHENRFTKTILDDDLNEPMELEVFDDGRVIFVERRGAIKIYDPEKEATATIYTMPVYSNQEDGLLGVALDPNYEENNWVYFFYSPVGDEPKQHISRFVLKGNELDTTSEVVILEIPTQRDECCHSGGSLEFDKHGNLYISVGDDTNPFASDGYAPIDGTPGRKAWDARRTSGNVNDLRGAILRITPKPDGTYDIPEGNLYPPGTEGARPEIYVKGCRNPFRIAIDDHTGYVYWGDVGPDAGEDGEDRGPRGHDEVNQARKAGYFGWPLFNGNNKPYHAYDFGTKKSGEKFDPAKPINDSPNNTGLQELPPAQEAYIWYPYAASEEFPLVGKGGRNAMAGMVYYHEDYKDAPKAFPAYYDKKLFIYEWMRGWIMAVTMDEEGDLISMERFMPSTKFSNPTDMVMHKDGSLYMLEYGTAWFKQNKDARLIRIDYTSGNRPPIAKLETDKTAGGVPLTVQFTGDGSEDLDKDDISFAWSFTNGKTQSTEANPSFTFKEAGKYEVKLTVTDATGAATTSKQTIVVGNTPPAIAWEIEGNSTFYFDDVPIDYNVAVTDAEDGTINADNIVLTIDYLLKGYDITEIAQGHQTASGSGEFAVGKTLIDGSDCLACHQVHTASAGPSYLEVAQKYGKASDKEVTEIASRIIKGGSGIWGETQMSAHPQHSQEEAEDMVRYILSLSETKEDSYAPKGTYQPVSHLDRRMRGGKYIFTASYEDAGANGLPAASTQEMLVLRSPKVQFEDHDEASEGVSAFELDDDQKKLLGFPVRQELKFVIGLSNGKYLKYSGIDLTNISMIQSFIGCSPPYSVGGIIELRLGSPDGEKVSEVTLIPSPDFEMPKTFTLAGVKGKHDLYFLFKNEEKPDDMIGTPDFMQFVAKGKMQ